MTNLEWIQSGKTGCTFATLFSKNPKSVGWKFIDYDEYMANLIPENTLILSIIFHNGFNKDIVRKWALEQGFYEEKTSDNTIGLRIKSEQGVSWVQYFGPDSHVVTRQAPQPMLMYTRRLNTSHYIKVGFKGILHLAHAWRKDVSEKVYDLLWERSYKQTEKLIGHKPTIVEASKTTWLK